MRIVVMPIGSAGDVHPLVGVGKALQARGHEVVVVTNGYFGDLVRKAGLEFHALGSAEDYLKLAENPDLWHPRRAFATIFKGALNHAWAPTHALLRDLYRPGNTVLVAGTLGLAARNAHEALGVPLVTVHLAPSIFFSTYRAPRFAGMFAPDWAPRWLKRAQFWAAGRLTDAVVLPALNRFRRELGLGPARDIVRTWWHSPQRVLGLFPEWFGPPQPDWPPQTRLAGFPLFDEDGLREPPAGLEAFLAAGEPPVVFTPGTAMRHGTRFFTEAVRACELLGQRGILLTQFAETVPRDLPPSVAHFSYIPFSRVLPRAAALVSHGGIGTTAQALRAGIPHLVQHMAHDQMDNGSRLQDLGTGDMLPAGAFRAPRVARLLRGLLESPAVAQAARAIAARFAGTDPVGDACRIIEEAARG